MEMNAYRGILLIQQTDIKIIVAALAISVVTHMVIIIRHGAMLEILPQIQLVGLTVRFQNAWMINQLRPYH